jgi:hypothetical protein
MIPKWEFLTGSFSLQQQPIMITIVNFAWGDWPGGVWPWKRTLLRRYFRNFREAMKRHSTCEFRHVLYAENPSFFDNRYTRSQKNLLVKPLGEISKWRGCMPKLEAFNNDPDLQGQVFVFDLDNVIAGNLDELLAYRGGFLTCMDPLPGRENKVGGNIVSFPAGTMSHVYRLVMENHVKYDAICKGSERYLLDHFLEAGVMSQCDYIQNLFAGLICSLKLDLASGNRSPEHMKILWLHGQPRPHKLRRKGFPGYHRMWTGKS